MTDRLRHFATAALASLAAGLAALPLAAPLAAQTEAPAGTQAPYTVVETGRAYERLQDAVNAIGGGTGTIRFASLRFADCAVQTAGDVTYQAEVPGQAVLDGVACEGKAALVLRGRAAPRAPASPSFGGCGWNRATLP